MQFSCRQVLLLCLSIALVTLWCGYQFQQDQRDQMSSHLNKLFMSNKANASKSTLGSTGFVYSLGQEVRNSDKKVKNMDVENSGPEMEYSKTGIMNSILEVNTLKPENEKFEPEINKLQAGGRVILMTSFRGGSSFLGGLFLANPEVFYMFEPLYICNLTYLGAVSERVHDLLKQSCIRSLLDCNIRTFYDDLEYIEPNQSKRRHEWLTRIFGKPMRESGVSAMDPKMNDVCRNRYKHRIMKIIRGYSLESFLPLMKNGVKIIYSIRDPRGTINSRRINTRKPLQFFHQEAFSECSKHDRNLEFIQNILGGGSVVGDPESADVLKEQLRIIRYDDLANNPIAYAEQIYAFLNLSFLPIVRKYIEFNPRVKEWSLPSPTLLEQLYKEINSTHENSSMRSVFQYTKPSGLKSWNRDLTFSEVEVIQNKCANMMSLVGINKYNSESDLKDPAKLRLTSLPSFWKELTFDV